MDLKSLLLHCEISSLPTIEGKGNQCNLLILCCFREILLDNFDCFAESLIKPPGCFCLGDMFSWIAWSSISDGPTRRSVWICLQSQAFISPDHLWRPLEDNIKPRRRCLFLAKRPPTLFTESVRVLIDLSGPWDLSCALPSLNVQVDACGNSCLIGLSDHISCIHALTRFQRCHACIRVSENISDVSMFQDDICSEPFVFPDMLHNIEWFWCRSVDRESIVLRTADICCKHMAVLWFVMILLSHGDFTVRQLESLENRTDFLHLCNLDRSLRNRFHFRVVPCDHECSSKTCKDNGDEKFFHVFI